MCGLYRESQLCVKQTRPLTGNRHGVGGISPPASCIKRLIPRVSYNGLWTLTHKCVPKELHAAGMITRSHQDYAIASKMVKGASDGAHLVGGICVSFAKDPNRGIRDSQALEDRAAVSVLRHSLNAQLPEPDVLGK